MLFHRQLIIFVACFGPMVFVQEATAQATGNEDVVVCQVYEFACKNGSECIPSEWRCDRDFDCKDSSDEQDCGEYCDPEISFKCINASRCVPHGWVCDGIDDCGDNSDEQGEECESPFESCSRNEYQCPGSNDCIPIHLLCNSEIDCGDRSDEGSHCVSQVQKCAEKGCSDLCKYSITGARCYCNEGRQLNADNVTCSDYNECLTVRVPVCDQKCINQMFTSNTCECVDGFSLQQDTRTCKSDTATTAKLLVASGEKIKIMSLTGDSSAELDSVRANAINYDFKRKKICWVDRTTSKRILKCVNSETMADIKKIQVPFDMRGVEQFAIEWITGNFYFVDSRSDRIFICTADDDDNYCLTIVSSGLANPRGIAIDPNERYFFISDWSNQPRITRYSINGSNEEVIVKTKISLPQCLTLDIFTKRVYWTDANMDHIQSIPYDGNQALRYTVINEPDLMDHPYGVAVFENYIYSTNWNDLFEIRKTSRFEAFNNKSLILSKGTLQSAAIQVYHSSLQPMSDHPCSDNNGGCDHFCLLVEGDKKDYCQCSVGFILQEDGTCRRQNLKDGFLLYGMGMPGAIKGISINPDDKFDVIEPLLNMESPRALDFDVKEEYVYYADSVAFRIVRRPLVGKESEAEVLLDQYVNNCEGIAVDWISRNLYWTDDGLDRISMSTLNGSYSKTLITTNLTHPRAIAVDPVAGYMYWTDWSEYDIELGMIERANLDGTNREVLVSGENILWPNGIALDKDGGYLYWCDAFFDEISRVFLDGSGKRMIYNGGKVEAPFGLSFFNNYLFWTERESGKIFRYEIPVEDEVNMPLQLRDEDKELYAIRVYSSQLQSGTNECSSSNGDCEQLCANTLNGIVCLCQNGDRLRSDNKTCETDPDFPRGTHCNDDEMTCNNGRCVRKLWKCDGDDDCGDGSDESPEVCSSKSCHPDLQFMCSNYKCIPKKYQCDGDSDCHDGGDEDETLCQSITCSPDEFSCDNDKCILPVWVCDREDDCGDNSDEIACVYESCEENEFSCTNGRCINHDWRCDTDNDCGDNSDELFCQYSCSNDTQFTCDSLQCIDLEFVCNGVDDCADGSDEALPSCTPSPSKCHESEFDCGSGNCINIEYICDSKEDCLDGSDEVDCGTIVYVCDNDEFQCNNGLCIPLDWKCDDDNDCDDASDEGDRTCPPKLCDNGAWQCPNHTLCIPLVNLCDGDVHCPNGYDEAFDCDIDACTHPTMQCSHGCQNAPVGHYCTCPEGFKLNPSDLSTCEPDMNMCEKKRCSQQCTNLKGNYTCSCYDGYQQTGDRWTCKANDTFSPMLVFSNRHQLRFYDLRTEEYGILVSGMRNTIALDFYQAENSVFWTDVVDDKIYRAYFTNDTLSEGSELTGRTVVVSSGLATAEGLAVDWIGQNLYWVDSLLDQIEVAKLNGSSRTTVIAGNMESPRAIALDSRKGIMFWTDWDNNLPRIESASMSGMNRTVVVTVADMSGGWPNGLTLDYEEDRILWIDARSDSIHSAYYNGSDIITILKGHQYLYHPFAITLFEGYLYWSDWRTNMVYKARKWTGDDLQPVQKTQTQPFDIHVVHPYRQPKAANPCENNGGCSHLCLLNGNEPACLCPHMMKLGPDMKKCENDMAFLVILKPTVIRGVDLNDGDFSVIPSWTLPRILNVSSITCSSKENRFYWVDINRKTISRAFINGTGLQTVIAGVTGGTSIALDWITGNIMWTSKSLNDGQINVAKVDGSYRNVVINGLEDPSNLILQPDKGLMYWINNGTIKQSTMNGTQVVTLPINNLNKAKSIVLSTDGNTLYWADSGQIGMYNLQSTEQSIFYSVSNDPIALAAHKDHLYWADNSSSIFSVTFTEEKTVTTIKEDYADIKELLVYDPKAQTATTNACTNSTCQQMCLPISESTKTCLCTTGYVLDADQISCIGIRSFLLYSVDSSIQGLTLNDTFEQALTPITGTALSVSIDFDYKNDYIYWVDTQASRIRRIKRDLSDRQSIISDGLGRVEGIAYDWISGNIYWTDQQLDLIEVADFNGSYRYVLISDDLEKPRSIAVYPQKGLLFWSDWGRNAKIERSTLAGTERMVLVNTTISWPNGITIDYEEDYIYWCEAQLNRIERIKIDGTDRHPFIDSGLLDPFSITILGDMMYWTDRTFNGGSIRSAKKINGDNTTTLLSNIGIQIKDIHAFHESKQQGTNLCAADGNPCEQLCFYTGNNKLKCACAYGLLNEDGKTCRNYNAFIVYSERNMLRTLSMANNSNVYQNAWEPIQNDYVKNAVSLAVDFNKQLIFYSDIQRGNIEQIMFNGTGHKTVVEGVGSAEGLTYDPIFQEIYWTSYSNSSINRVRSNSDPEIIVQLSSQDRPRGIVVDPCTQYLFWTNWNENAPSIMKSHTNGLNTHSIITDNIRTPNSITIDHSAQKLYWADARIDKIERCNFDGTNRHVVLTSDPVHPFGLVVHENYLYWTDWVRRSVVRVNKFTGADLVVVRKQLPQQPMGIAVAFNDTDKCLLWPCNINNGGCEYTCNTDEYGLVLCSCPANQIVSDTYRCINKTVSCANGSFACHDGACVDYEASCNGLKNCPDGSDEDENYCSMRVCRQGYFTCRSGGCILSKNRCNGINDCRDGSDELDCLSCTAEEFQCTDRSCIDGSRLCDFRIDCEDAGDEMGCPPTDCGLFALNRLVVPLPEGMVLNECANTTLCYLPTWECDGENDCGDNSDEAQCQPTPKTTSCEEGFFTCTQSGRCIPMSWKCDQDNDCADGEDEQDSCEYTCLQDQFQCTSGRCIPEGWRCDDDNDCGDQSDEGDHCDSKTCDPEKFMCEGSNICIPLSWVCDGDVDCENGTDEFPVRGCAATTCYDGEFACDNKRCIQESWKCDHEDDCGDNSDEYAECVYTECTDEEFTCNNQRCVAIGWKCDGANDCHDNSDEEGCETPSNQFCCTDDHKCIALSYVCNGKFDCKDGSDEINCNTTECGETSPCEQQCRDTLQGYECYCDTGYQLTDDRHSCEDVDECTTSYPCSQQCFNTVGGFRCACAPNYILEPDKRRCKADSGVKPMIYFSNRYLIRKIDVHGQTYTRVSQQLQFSNVVALDFDWQEQKLYWSDVTQQGSMISRMDMDGNNKEGIHTLGVKNPDGLAVDWIGRNLYWCDKGLDVIEVSKLDGRYRKTLISEDLDEPRAIIVNPMKGEMFWTDWGLNPYIAKAGMDGENVQKIVTYKLGWPNGLTIDYATNYIFWADAREDRIEMANSDGENRRTIIRQSSPHIFAITLFEDWIYWSDWENRTISKAHKYSGLNQTLLVTNRHRPMDLHVVHPLRQISGTFNPCEDGGPCSNLCLLKQNEEFTCACPNNFYLAGDEANCVSNCSASQFTCGNDKCVPYWWRCDGEDDCNDKTDEPDNCPPFFCQPGQFQCNSSTADDAQCINPSFLCDADNDCTDGSDELNCYTHTCLPSQWKCEKASKCIALSYKCDGIDHCPSEDGGVAEDEQDCPPPTCSSHHFQCVVTGRCIPNIWVCDQEADCVNGTDEINCENQSKTCPPDEFMCNSGNCVPITWNCDGESDCADGSDEIDCETTTCPTSKFQCVESGRCIPTRWRCDLDQDCSDNSDEADCPSFECTEEERKCATENRCIPNRWWCDEEDDCGDNSDEEDCGSEPDNNCNENEFQCLNSHCIPSTWRCDSDLDCVDGSDEDDCNVQPNRVCSLAEYTCDNNQCKPKAWLCDGDDDCGDNSDEKEEICSFTQCSSFEFQCLNKKCIPSNQLCNGEDNCGDGSDEHCDDNHCESDQFKCDNMQCIHYSLVCDHIKHCGNASDEMYCMNATNPCDVQGQRRCDICVPTTKGYYCECRQGFKLEADRSCSDIDECSEFGYCSQLCTNNEGGYFCSCDDGYYKEIKNGNSVCKAEGDPEYLLLPESSQVIKYSPERNSFTSEYYGEVRIGAMDFHYKSSTVFVINSHEKNISKLVLSEGFRKRRDIGQDTGQETLPIAGLKNPQDIAVDWVTQKIYWTDAVDDNPVIQVANLNGYNQMTLIDSNLDEPLAIVLHPKKGLMFWSDYGANPKIGVANMDGSGVKDLVTKDLQWPSGLAVDHIQDRLYWADPKAKVIGSIKTDGSDYRIVINSTALLKIGSSDAYLEPYALDIFEDWIYCLTYKKNEMFRINKFGVGKYELLKENIRQISDLVIVQEHKQQDMKNPCDSLPCAGGVCYLSSPKAVCKCFSGAVLKNGECSGTKCTKNYCSNGGTCQMNSDQVPVCSCLEGFYGKNCERQKINPCVNFCRNGGNCTVKDSVAECSCPVQYVGAQCGKDLCNGYCKNSGLCTVKEEDPRPTCSCPADFTGNTCQTSLSKSKSKQTSSQSGSLQIAIPIIIFILIIIIIGAVFCYRRQRLLGGFKHSRLDSADTDRNFGNPMYIYKPHNEDGLLESPFEMDIEKTSNFSNPAYGSLYNDRNSGSQLSLDEKKNLIDEIEDDNQPLIVDDFDMSFNG
ncbi:low-density lipoprotein receptor-related protein 1-like isoform X2 [Antedon mediterranea]|uniref:low-density lipoprotein receptor-related protein 1-like isoform X2 n=1 Tax=Antedon mediterranea TaxID=105859 RepID=UPI003AF4A025